MTVTDLPTSNNETLKQLQAMQAEIDALQVHVMSTRKRWYHDASAVVAVLAFIFSLTTTAVAYVQTKQNNVEADRTALRQFMQRLLTLPQEMTTMQRDYRDSPPEQLEYLLGLKRQEATAIARQALRRLHDRRQKSLKEFRTTFRLWNVPL
ncbi:MAG TPA: hypothetical protein VII75_00935 [Thermoanaerobaculia bacterium]